MLSDMKKAAAIASCSAVAISTFANAESVMLDIPTGENNTTNFEWSSAPSLMNGFDISSEHMNFQDLGHWATPGNLFAYDYATSSRAVGRITITGHDSDHVDLMGLNLSGYGSVDTSAILRVFADGELLFENLFEMAGKSDLRDVRFEGITGSRIDIELENVLLVGVGMDNIEIGVVPAPGAIALLGLAGVAGSRRRRR